MFTDVLDLSYLVGTMHDDDVTERHVRTMPHAQCPVLVRILEHNLQRRTALCNLCSFCSTTRSQRAKKNWGFVPTTRMGSK